MIKSMLSLWKPVSDWLRTCMRTGQRLAKSMLFICEPASDWLGQCKVFVYLPGSGYDNFSFILAGKWSCSDYVKIPAIGYGHVQFLWTGQRLAMSILSFCEPLCDWLGTYLEPYSDWLGDCTVSVNLPVFGLDTCRFMWICQWSPRSCYVYANRTVLG
jgi:hypothetical protein